MSAKKPTKTNNNIVEQLLPLAIDLNNLVLFEGNARKGDVDAIVTSYKTFGQRKPIVAKITGKNDDGYTGEIIAGNHQYKAAMKLGWDKIAVVFVNDDEITAKAYALADNRTAELGGYDNDMLIKLIEEVSMDENLMAATAWTMDDLHKIQKMKSGKTDPDQIPEDVPSITQTGDVWELGKHRLICGDATDYKVYEKLTKGEKMDLVWTDPPYGVEVVNSQGMTIKNDEKDMGKLNDLLVKAFENAEKSKRAGAVWYVAAPAGPNNLIFSQILNNMGIWRQTICWVKSALVMGHSDYHYRHESIFYGWTPDGERVAPPTMIKIGEDDDFEEGYDNIYYGWTPDANHKRPPDRKQDTIWEIPKVSHNTVHPTMKPVDLILRSIYNSTKQGDKVLDMFTGSGSTLIAAEQSKRKAFCVELDPHYADVICKRFQEHTGIMPKRNGEEVDFSINIEKV